MHIFYIFILIFTLPLFSEVKIKKPKVHRILVAGDVMFNWGMRETREKLGVDAPIEGLKDIFAEADYKMLNLETPVAENREDIDKEKPYLFNGIPDDLELLQKLGVDLVFLGNNHSMDYGKKGLEETLMNLKKKKFDAIGAGLTYSDAYNYKEIIWNKGKIKIFSVSAIGENRLFATDKKPGTAFFNVNKLKSFIPKKRGEETYILSVHWGVEYNPEPTRDQIAKARDLINSGYQIIIGHHPHIPQGIEKYKNGIIFYSLGNFMFGSRNSYLNHNMAIMLHFVEGKLELCEIIPIFGKFQNSDHLMRPLEEKEAKDFLAEIKHLSEKLGTNIEIKRDRAYIKM